MVQISSTDPVDAGITTSKSASPLTAQNEDATNTNTPPVHRWTEKVMESVKIILSLSFLLSSIYTTYNFNHSPSFSNHNPGTDAGHAAHHGRRRLSVLKEGMAGGVPSYMNDLMKNLREREKLFEDTPPEEVKYWFEYTGPLQKYFYRYSRSRGKADYFEGRDDSGVVSSRFSNPGGGTEHSALYKTQNLPKEETSLQYRLLDNCFALGNTKRPDLSSSSLWYKWFGSSSSSGKVMDRCRLLITMNTVGAGRGSTMLWETQPPPIHQSNPQPWMSEQATAATHLERNLKEMDEICKSGFVAIRLQVLVCEPIPGAWTDYIDSMLPNCGGQSAPFMDPKGKEMDKGDSPYEQGTTVEERPSPVQVVVVASPSNADTCHDLKSGFMEKRVQDLILTPPYLDSKYEGSEKEFDPSVKTTHPDLVSSDDYDVYVGMKWSSLLTMRSLSSFLQASADIAAAASSPQNQTPLSKDDGATVQVNTTPSSPFLIPSFLRVSYISEENNKVAKWRMHGDFFHPAAWEICKDSFDVTWIPDSLSGNGGVGGICYDESHPANVAVKKRLSDGSGEDCGQWWIYMAEEQMSLNPEVYANEAVPPLVQGGGNQFWMLTERHRKEVLKVKVCEYHAIDDAKDNAKDGTKGDETKLNACPENPQAVMPLGDMESFLINFTPNTALGKKHTIGRRPGYSREEKREKDRETVRERKQLKGQEDIEKALFDYTVYPAALFRKDATIKAARARDAALQKEEDKERIGPQVVKSSYFDVTIKKPREATLGWCQAIARKGLCTLYGQYFRESLDKRCMEACGLKRNWTSI